MSHSVSKLPSHWHHAAKARPRTSGNQLQRSNCHRANCVEEIRKTYLLRRNLLCDGLNSIGWTVSRPRATMFVWAQIPEQFKSMGSLEFSKLLLREAKVAVSPGIGFGQYGDDHVRFALIENEHRTRQAIRGLRRMFRTHPTGVRK